MQYRPRKRAKKIVPRIRSWHSKDAKLSGFPSFKVGMTHLVVTDNSPTSISKGQPIQVPATILECPPIKIAAIRLYTKDHYGLHCSGQITADKPDKDLAKRFPLPKKKKEAKTDNLADVRVLAHTQPKLTMTGQKIPDILELGIGGKSAEEKLKYAQEILGKEVNITDVFGEGQLVDSTSITKGKGFQGPVKRFGVMLRVHKSEKTRRGPGSLGPWHGHRQFTVAKAGQTGYHQRTELNKHIIKIGDKPEEINPKGGFLRYGLVKNPYLLVKGSLGGPAKRLITLTAPRRHKQVPKEPPAIVHTSTSAQ